MAQTTFPRWILLNLFVFFSFLFRVPANAIVVRRDSRKSISNLPDEPQQAFETGAQSSERVAVVTCHRPPTWYACDWSNDLNVIFSAVYPTVIYMHVSNVKDFSEVSVSY